MILFIKNRLETLQPEFEIRKHIYRQYLIFLFPCLRRDDKSRQIGERTVVILFELSKDNSVWKVWIQIYIPLILFWTEISKD